ncbi:AAA domain family protein [Orientia chuto str. Dubai]|uniref:AAA domain family protein n=1 Tax=Orientia chuto str. Dubai TaxID=1359168 RepID=A0A0F3MGB9_9RICK|nr:YifB family Mg chelatase-like AAA ATPase [Candidatus Orientia mediorientalis]KJV54813.1 AAA domain family protein [Orientia chuto str. Dubai]
MVTRISSLTWNGIGILDVDIQVKISTGIPCFTIVGLADKTVTEARERVKAAIASMGLALPAKKILVNLAPADLVKEGSHFDLAIACGLLTSMNVLHCDEMTEYLILGELSLDGTLLPIAGVLPAAIGAVEREKGIICPVANSKEAAWSNNKKIVAPKDLLSLVNHFKGTQVIQQPEIDIRSLKISYPDLKDIIGQTIPKRALEIAAAGQHHMLMSGPPGTGKSMLAERLPGILPEMTPIEILECSMIASVANLIRGSNLIQHRPFRSPHHTCSIAAMVGGGVGKRVKPGEISLAHNGVLFLDELPEFSTNTIEALRQPLELAEVHISRVNFSVKYPARFQLIAAMNPCKCGYLSDAAKACNKAPRCGTDYQMKISGPMMDRFDIYVEVPEITYNIDDKHTVSESSTEVLKRVNTAHNIQYNLLDIMDMV